MSEKLEKIYVDQVPHMWDRDAQQSEVAVMSITGNIFSELNYNTTHRKRRVSVKNKHKKWN